jgi:hypothetical protein
VGVRPPGANGGTDLVFSNLDRLGPDRVDRAGPWTVRIWTGPARLQYSNACIIYEENEEFDIRALFVSDFL